MAPRTRGAKKREEAAQQAQQAQQRPKKAAARGNKTDGEGDGGNQGQGRPKKGATRGKKQQGSDEWKQAEGTIEEQRQRLITEMIKATRNATLPQNFHDLDVEHKRVGDGKTGAEKSRARKNVFKTLKNTQLDPANRKWADRKRMEATALYEDFLYYQTALRRHKWEQDLDQKGPKNRVRHDPGTPIMFRYEPEYLERLLPFFRKFEALQTGMGVNLKSHRIGPDEIHIPTPPARRRPVGWKQINAPLRWKDYTFDVEAIERRRREIEDREEEGGETASARRRRTFEQLKSSPLRYLPTAFRAFEDKPASDDIELVDKPASDVIKRLKVHNGLYLAAAETPWDWLTSYDKLDPVRRGFITDVPAQPPESNERGSHDEGAEDNHPKGGERELGVIPRLEYNEFWRPPRVAATQPRKMTSTRWAEATNGRREWHVHQKLDPYSPVNSPPHSLLPRDTGVPVDVSRMDPDFARYRQKYTDHHGVGLKQWPEFKGRRQGDGFQVPYKPLDVAQLPAKVRDRLPKRIRDSHNRLDSSGKFAHPALDGTSMKILREKECLKELANEWSGQGDEEWALSEDEGDAVRWEEDQEEEVYDDGNIFSKAYQAGAATQPQGNQSGSDGSKNGGGNGGTGTGNGAQASK